MSIYELTPQTVHVAEPLFAGWQESLIWSCLQGYMGRLLQIVWKIQSLPEFCLQIFVILPEK